MVNIKVDIIQLHFSAYLFLIRIVLLIAQQLTLLEKLEWYWWSLLQMWHEARF